MLIVPNLSVKLHTWTTSNKITDCADFLPQHDNVWCFLTTLQWISYGVTCAVIFNSLRTICGEISEKKKLWKGLIYKPIISPISWRWEPHCEPRFLLYRTFLTFIASEFYKAWPSASRYISIVPGVKGDGLKVKLAITVATMFWGVRTILSTAVMYCSRERGPALIEIASWKERRDQRPRLGWRW